MQSPQDSSSIENQAHPSDGSELPLFPLGTVLFPDGVLPLRIFETRYVDMVRRCMSSDSPFGVCLITRGGEVGSPAEHHSIGCTARIVDFGMEEGGVLRILAVGGHRFEVLDRWVRKDGLLMGRARAINQDPVVRVPEHLSACSPLMEAIANDLRTRMPENIHNILAEPMRIEEAGWVANRLSELLPLDPTQRHHLMTLADPVDRLARIAALLTAADSPESDRLNG